MDRRPDSDESFVGPSPAYQLGADGKPARPERDGDHQRGSASVRRENGGMIDASRRRKLAVDVDGARRRAVGKRGADGGGTNERVVFGEKAFEGHDESIS